MANPYRPLEKELGYRFRRRARLEHALTHRSFRFEQPEVDFDNQRLEYLGDAALGLVAAAHLYQVFPGSAEGDLTRRRSLLTSTNALANIAGDAGIGDFLRLGRGEEQSGGAQRDSTLADTLEAIIGAAFLDGGTRAVERIFARLFAPRIEDTPEAVRAANPKGELQERCQRRWKISPRYELVETSGPSHARRFRVRVLLGERALATGEGTNKRHAETEAARAALETLEDGGLAGPG